MLGSDFRAHENTESEPMKFTIAVAAGVLGLILGGVVYMLVYEVRKKSFPWYAVYAIGLIGFIVWLVT